MMLRTRLNKFKDKHITNPHIQRMLRSIFYFFEDFISKDILAKNNYLKNIHQGKRCFVFCTGQSVNNVDFSILYNEHTFGGNYIFKHNEFHKLNLKHYVFSGPLSHIKELGLKSIYANPSIYAEDFIFPWLQPQKHTLGFSSIPDVLFQEIDVALSNDALLFLNSDTNRFLERNNIFQNNSVYFLKTLGKISSYNEQRIDLSKRITGNGVFSAIICIALYMGFKELYIIGNDYTFEPAQQFHFYDSPVFSKRLLKETAEDLINRIAIARDVEVYGIKEDEEFYKPVYVKYNSVPDEHLLIKDFAESIGVKIYNVVPDGFTSPIYHGVSWQHVVEKVLKV